MNEDALAKLERNIITVINCLKDKVLNMRNTRKRSQENNERLRQECSSLEGRAISAKSSLNQLQQSGR